MMKRPWVRWLRRLIAYAFVKSVTKIGEILPARIGRRLYVSLGRASYYLLPNSRRIALANLRVAFGEHAADKEIRAIAKATFANLGRFAYDIVQARHRGPEWVKHLATVRGKHNLDEALARGKGVIALTGHVGNWELLAAYFSMIGYPINVLATSLKDSKLNDLLVKMRTDVGVRVLDRSKGLIQAFRCLKRGEVLGVLIDQDTSVESVLVDFLGTPAKTAVGAVKLASRTGAAIVPLAMTLNDSGHYEIDIKEALKIGGRDETLREDVELCSKAIEDFIRRKPSQWVWMHKRWKSVLGEIYQ